MRVIVAGAGALGREVAGALSRQRHDVVVIDDDKAICETVYAELGVVAVHGNATDLHVLDEAGARKSDVVATLMHLDTDNVACALLAHSLGVEQIIARLRDPLYEDAYREAGVTHVVRATLLLRNQILLHIAHPEVRQIVDVGHHEADLFSIDIPASARVAGMPIREIAAQRGFPRESLIAGISAADQDGMTIPRGDDVVNATDRVFVFCRPSDVEKIVKLLTRG